MKTKKLTPRNAAPVQRENTATVARDGNTVVALWWLALMGEFVDPFAGDDAE